LGLCGRACQQKRRTCGSLQQIFHKLVRLLEPCRAWRTSQGRLFLSGCGGAVGPVVPRQLAVLVPCTIGRVFGRVVYYRVPIKNTLVCGPLRGSVTIWSFFCNVEG